MHTPFDGTNVDLSLPALQGADSNLYRHLNHSWRGGNLGTSREVAEHVVTAVWAACKPETRASVVAPPIVGKPINTVQFNVHATYVGDAQRVLDVLWNTYGQPVGKTFAVTHGAADGNRLHVWITYGPVKGGEKADVRRVLERCAKQAGVELSSQPEIDVLERVRHD